jgi:hypothetical protein
MRLKKTRLLYVLFLFLLAVGIFFSICHADGAADDLGAISSTQVRNRKIHSSVNQFVANALNSIDKKKTNTGSQLKYKIETKESTRKAALFLYICSLPYVIFVCIYTLFMFCRAIYLT